MTSTPRPIHLADILEAMADAIPDRIAIATIDRDYSYAEIDDRSTRLANHLVGLGIQPGDRIAVHSANRIEWVDAFYACLKARAIPININFKYQHDELAYLYGNAECVATVLAPEHVDAVEALNDPTLKHHIVLDETFEDRIASGSTQRLGGRSADDHYILYTGGTTGSPKGVIWRQEDLIRPSPVRNHWGVSMDPNATLNRLLDAILADDMTEAVAALDDIMTWIHKGGSKPNDPRRAQPERWSE